MGKQIQKEKQASQEEKPAEVKPTDLKPKGEEIKAAADDLIDQIDDILQDNAEQFIQAYVQRGGQ